MHTELYNRVTIQGSSSPWLAGNSYTLTCVATTDITPQVKWTDPSGNPVVEGEGLTLSGPAVFGGNTTLRLTFNYLRTSQAGRYSCLSIIATPTSVQSEVWDTTVQSESVTKPQCVHNHIILVMSWFVFFLCVCVGGGGGVACQQRTSLQNI